MPSLISPEVSVTIIDESFYVPGRATTVPVIFIATADEKTQADGATPALGTYEHGVVREVTSIRQSLELYGIPRFLESATGEPHHGDARNEYGLDALNKFLEVANRAIVVRANVNLNDDYAHVKAMWNSKMADAAEYLQQLAEDTLDEVNASNGWVPYDSEYKESITKDQFTDILNEVMVDVFDSYSFSSREFQEGFMQNHNTLRAGYQEAEFDTYRGYIQTTDVTGVLNDATLYGATATLVTDGGTENVTFYFAGEDIQTFGDLLTQLNVELGNGTIGVAELISGQVRITSALDGPTSYVEITSDGPSGYLPLFGSMNLFSQLGTSYYGKGAFPLDVYDNTFDSAPLGNFIGMAGIISEWSAGDPVTIEFTPTEAVSEFLDAAQAYDNTKEFLNTTSLGANDAARRAAIVKQLQAEINNPLSGIRSETYEYNIAVAPGYYELSDELLRLSSALFDEVFVIGDTPFNKPPTGPNSIVLWATTTGDEVGLGGKKQDYSIAYYYGHGISSNIDGANIMTSAASTALRVYAYNDLVGEQWYAPAGTQRGGCPHLTNLGYVTGALGTPTTWVEDWLDNGTRDSLYEEPKNINPITFKAGRGILVLGQKTTSKVTSALDRVNVSRLVKFIKRQLRKALFAYLFEPNDEYTRSNVKATADEFLMLLIDRRGLYDFATICDDSNNTPATIDRNELWLDIAIKPVKAVEFIYVPIRVVNTGTDIGTGV